MKTAKQLEKHFKGLSNHWRIRILLVVDENPNITVEKVAESLDANFKTISEHIKKMVAAGLVNKKYRGKSVTHTLSPYGKDFLKFIKNFPSQK